MCHCVSLKSPVAFLCRAAAESDLTSLEVHGYWTGVPHYLTTQYWTTMDSREGTGSDRHWRLPQQSAEEDVSVACHPQETDANDWTWRPGSSGLAAPYIALLYNIPIALRYLCLDFRVQMAEQILRCLADRTRLSVCHVFKLNLSPRKKSQRGYRS